MVSSKVFNPLRTYISNLEMKNRIIQGLLMCRVISNAGRNLNDINVGAYTRFIASLDITLFYDFLQDHLICRKKSQNQHAVPIAEKTVFFGYGILIGT